MFSFQKCFRCISRCRCIGMRDKCHAIIKHIWSKDIVSMQNQGNCVLDSRTWKIKDLRSKSNTIGSFFFDYIFHLQIFHKAQNSNWLLHHSYIIKLYLAFTKRSNGTRCRLELQNYFILAKFHWYQILETKMGVLVTIF